jgi:hypothetical protein
MKKSSKKEQKEQNYATVALSFTCLELLQGLIRFFTA